MRACVIGGAGSLLAKGGGTPDFIPAVLDRNIYDEIVLVTEARDAARELAMKDRIFCGIFSGGTI